ncbi:hypothetical protein BS17DRAFT_782458 [Gyrodon lividus]|nr:hypothetical protein BS17DRAFT_782458 [Gyrodon lividus]
MAGLKEEIKGKILGEPEAAAHGRERRTGELKRREEARVYISLARRVQSNDINLL